MNDQPPNNQNPSDDLKPPATLLHCGFLLVGSAVAAKRFTPHMVHLSAERLAPAHPGTADI